jgi:preprotein translocase subunit SecG
MPAIAFLEILVFFTSLILIIVGLLQGKKNQDGLSALSGGNQELFAVKKERGIFWFLSILTMILGLFLFLICLIINIINTVG